MIIDCKTAQYVAELSKLRLDGDDASRVAEDLSRIVGCMDALRLLDTEGVEPMSHVFALKNVLRSDVVRPSMERGSVLDGAPVRGGAGFVVPKTVEQGS